MILEKVIFYIFSIGILLSALMVILSSNPVRGVLFLVLTFVSSSVLWILLHADFLGIILVLVYVGAVMTLFLFVVMMLNITTSTHRASFVRYVPVGVIVVLLILGMLITMVSSQYFGLSHFPVPAPQSAHYSSIAALGTVLYSHYVYPFEIAGVLLLVAIISAISLSHRKPHARQGQRPSEQVKVDPKSRLRIVKMAADKKHWWGKDNPTKEEG